MSDQTERDATMFAPMYGDPSHHRGVAVRFGVDAPESFAVPLPLLGGNASAELWPISGDASVEEGVHFVVAEDVLFGWTSVADDGGLESMTRGAYERILGVAHRRGFAGLLRVWNHVGTINEFDDGIERYQRFCVGRYEALSAAGYTMGADLPAASAVGMNGRGLVIYFLAGRRPAIQVENPRQVAAYEYPREYGPKSPSFSRAAIWRRDDGDVLFISGTASVVGHRSEHLGQVEGQLDETLVNLDAVVASALPGSGLADIVSLKVYVRNAADRDTIARKLEAAVSPSCSILYVESDICRKELLLEIEGVAMRRTRES
jgi:chorismate lyase/3-hydroxybenzoate synthase